MPTPKPKPRHCPQGTERTSFNLPTRTMDAIRQEAGAEGCSLNHIAAQVLNAYARGEIRRGFTQPSEPIGKR